MKATFSWRGLFLKGLIGTIAFALVNVFVYRTSDYFAELRAYRSAVDLLLAKPDVTQVLVGDSHVARLRANLLHDSVYNLATGGDGLRECYAKLRYLFEHDTRVNTVYLSLDYHMFGAGRLRSANGAFADWYLLRSFSAHGFEKGWLSALMNIVPLFNDDYAQYMRTKFGAVLKRSAGIRMPPPKPVWFLLSEEERISRAHRTGLSDHVQLDEFDEPYLWIERIVALTRAHNVRLIGVRYPAHPAYASAATPDRMERIHDRVAQLGVQDVRDFRSTFSRPECFTDADHLSPAGALVLARMLEVPVRTGVTGWAWALDERHPKAPVEPARCMDQLPPPPPTSSVSR